MRAGALQISGGMLETGWWGPGPAEAPTVVLLHEGLGSVALWRDVPERLARATGWGVFAYSRFGYGNSDTTALPRPMTYLHHEGQVVLPEVLRAAGIRRAVLVGHSDGGSIAAIYAGSAGVVSSPEASQRHRDDLPFPRHGRTCPGHPSPLAGMQVAGTNPAMTDRAGSDPRYHPPLLSRQDTPGDRAAPALLGLVTIAAHFIVEELNIVSIRQIKAEYETGALRERLTRYHRDADAAFRGWNDAWLDPGFRDFDITGLLHSIQAPILALQGADDPYGTDVQLHVLEANVRVPITTQLIPLAKHSPHLEARETTLAAITDFIANLPRGSST